MNLGLRARIFMSAMVGLAFAGALTAPACAGPNTNLAGLIGFNAVTGLSEGGPPFHYQSTNYHFSDIGSIAFAADGGLYAVVKDDNGLAAFVGFNAVNGQSQGGPIFHYTGTNYKFNEIGSIAFAPDGSLHAVTNASGIAGLIGFNTVTGLSEGGPAFHYTGTNYLFDEIGSIAFAADGSLHAVTNASGIAGLIEFNTVTGLSEGGPAFHYTGTNYLFDEIGSIAFAADGSLHAVTNASGIAGLIGFNTVTGLSEGGPAFHYTGTNYLFDEIGGMAFAPDGSLHAAVLINPSDPAAVPEPASWMMVIGGFGLVGAGMRRRSAENRVSKIRIA